MKIPTANVKIKHYFAHRCYRISTQVVQVYAFSHTCLLTQILDNDN